MRYERYVNRKCKEFISSISEVIVAKIFQLFVKYIGFHCYLRSFVQVRTLGPELAAKSHPSSLSVEVWRLMESVRRNDCDAERSDDSSSQDTHENQTTNRMSTIHAILDNLTLPAALETSGWVIVDRCYTFAIINYCCQIKHVLISSHVKRHRTVLRTLRIYYGLL